MAYLDKAGLTTLANNINTKFTKKSENKFYTGTSEPTDAPNNAIFVNTDEDITAASLADLEGAQTLNETKPTDGNVHMGGYLERNAGYIVGDAVYSMKLPGGYYLECTGAGTTGSSEAEDYEKKSD